MKSLWVKCKRLWLLYLFVFPGSIGAYYLQFVKLLHPAERCTSGDLSICNASVFFNNELNKDFTCNICFYCFFRIFDIFHDPFRHVSLCKFGHLFNYWNMQTSVLFSVSEESFTNVGVLASLWGGIMVTFGAKLPAWSLRLKVTGRV